MDIAVKGGWGRETDKMSSVLVVDHEKKSRDVVADNLQEYFGLVECSDSLAAAVLSHKNNPLAPIRVSCYRSHIIHPFQ